MRYDTVIMNDESSWIGKTFGGYCEVPS